MLKNYYEIDENLSLNSFLKDIKEKKNSHYIILETRQPSFVDIRTIALKTTNLNEKLKNLKKNLVIHSSTDKKSVLDLLIETGERVLKTQEGYYDFIDALKKILELNLGFLSEQISIIPKKEIYALSEDDKISSARSLFLQKRVNLLPVIKRLEVIGELRPIDFLVTNLFVTEEHNVNFYNKNYRENVLNMPITNLVNNRPITIDKNKKIIDLIELMINKKLPSVIITTQGNLLYSIVSYKDIFNIYKKNLEVNKYMIEYSGSSNLYEDSFDLVQDFAEKSMKKIANMSSYDSLKITFKVIGDKDAGHQTRFIIKVLLAKGNNVLHIEKEISSGTSDELHNDKVKGRWNIPLIVQEALSALEKKVIEEKRKNK